MEMPPPTAAGLADLDDLPAALALPDAAMFEPMPGGRWPAGYVCRVGHPTTGTTSPSRRPRRPWR